MCRKRSFVVASFARRWRTSGIPSARQKALPGQRNSSAPPRKMARSSSTARFMAAYDAASIEAKADLHGPHRDSRHDGHQGSARGRAAGCDPGARENVTAQSSQFQDERPGGLLSPCGSRVPAVTCLT